MKNIFKIDITTYIYILISLLAGYIKETTIIYIIIIIHELGHVFFFTLNKIPILKITIYPFGGITTIDKKLHEKISKEIICNLGGIIFQILLQIIITLLYKIDLIVTSTYQIFTNYNITILIFNLLPLIPLDGNHLVFNLLTKFISYEKSYLIRIIIGIISLITFLIFILSNGLHDLYLIIFLILKLILFIKETKYIIYKYYLERILYNHYYNKIIYLTKFKPFRKDKYYYLKENNKIINEKKYLESKMLRK